MCVCVCVCVCACVHVCFSLYTVLWTGFPDPSAVKELYSRGPEDSTSSLEGMLSGSSPNSGDPGTDTRLSFTKAVVSR